MKRIVFLASLTAIAKKTTVPEQALIGKLNTVLHLSTTGDAALKLPIHISQLIWSNQQVFKEDIAYLSGCEGGGQSKQCAERIAEATPEWFTYAEPNALVADILTLFSHDNAIFNQPTPNNLPSAK